MKKTFKRFLSSALAAVMAASVLSVGMVTSAFAADGDTFIVHPSDFYENTNYSDSKANAKTEVDINGAKIKLNNAENYYQKIGARAGNKTFTNNYEAKTSDSEFRTGGGNRKFTVTPAADGELFVYWYTSSNDYTTKVGNVSRSAASSEKYNVIETSSKCLKGQDIVIEFVNSNICMLAIEFVPGEVDAYNWTIDYNDSPVKKDLVLGGEKTVDAENTLSYMGTDYVLKDEYKKLTGDTEGVTVSGKFVTVKPTDAWFTPVKTVSVEPEITDNKTEYNFVDKDTSTIKHLIAGSDSSKSVTTAYGGPNKDAGDDIVNYVEITGEGALLYDDTDASGTQLVIPFTATSGKYTISGTVKPTKNVGTNWNLLDLGANGIALRSGSNSVLAITKHDGKAITGADMDLDKVTVGREITYNITIDIDNKLLDAEIHNGDFSDSISGVSLDNAGIDNITFVTNDGGDYTQGDDRPLLIPSVTIESEKVELDTTPAAGAVLETASDTYIIAGVTADDMENSNLTIGVGDKPSLDTTETVFESVVINGTKYSAADVGSDYAYIYAIKLVGANKNEQAKNFTVTLN